MQFALTYRGPVPSEQQGARTEKHLIRKQMHPQLRQWWKECRPLKGYWDTSQRVLGRPSQHEVSPPFKPGIEWVADDFEMFGFRWVPLVRSKQRWACSLRIEMFARQPPFGAFNGHGDLDNRVKTLIDGLCKPRQKGELPDRAVPESDENPFFVLLEDDSLVFDFSVSIERLLRPVQAGEGHNDVEAVIRVKVAGDEGDAPFAVTVA